MMDLKTLLGDVVSPEVIEKLEVGLTEAISVAVAEKEVELKEKHDAQLKTIEEQANSYADYIISEQLNEDHSDTELQYINKIEDLKEQAQLYGEETRQQVIAEANTYANQFIAEYTSTHKELFEALEKERTANDILESISAVLMSFGMTPDENKVIADLEESVKYRDSKIDTLESQLKDIHLQEQKKLILDKLTEGLSLSEKEKVTNIAKNVLSEDITNYESVVNMLVAKTEKDVDTNNKKINENVNTSIKHNMVGGIVFPTETNTITDFSKIIK